MWWDNSRCKCYVNYLGVDIEFTPNNELNYICLG